MDRALSDFPPHHCFPALESGYILMLSSDWFIVDLGLLWLDDLVTIVTETFEGCGTFHSTKKSEMFKMRKNDSEILEKVARKSSKIVEFPKSEPFNWKFPQKFREDSEMKRKFPAKNFQTFWYTSQVCLLFHWLDEFLFVRFFSLLLVVRNTNKLQIYLPL